MNDCINQIATAVAQVAAMLPQANGIPIPRTVQQLAVEIPRLEAIHQNEHWAGNGEEELLRLVTTMETPIILVMISKEVKFTPKLIAITIGMRDHMMWLSTFKTTPTKEASNTMTCTMT